MRQQKDVQTVAIISAMPIELAYVEEYLTGREGWEKIGADIYEYKKKQLRVVASVIGVGKVNAAYQTADLVIEHHPDIIINVGYAGGLVKGARKGDVAIGKEYVQVDFIPYREENRPPIKDSPEDWIVILEETARELNIRTFTGKIATGDFFLHSTEQKNQIIRDFSPIAFDMESAAVGQVATAKRIAFLAIRTFSDLADNNATIAIEENNVENLSRIPIEQRPVILAIHALEKCAE